MSEMSGQNPELVALCVIIMAGLVLFQAIVYFIFSLTFSRNLKKLREYVPLVARRVEDALKLTSGILTQIQSLARGVAVAQESLSLELTRIGSAIQQVDRTTQHTIAVLRDNLSPISGQVDKVLSQLSRQTFRVHRAILEPALEVSAVMRAVLATLTGLLSASSRGRSMESAPDDEIFI